MRNVRIWLSMPVLVLASGLAVVCAWLIMWLINFGEWVAGHENEDQNNPPRH